MERSALNREAITYIFHNHIPEQPYQPAPQEEISDEYRSHSQAGNHPLTCCYCYSPLCIGCCSISILGLLLAGCLGAL